MSPDMHVIAVGVLRRELARTEDDIAVKQLEYEAAERALANSKQYAALLRRDLGRLA